jgi:TRAP-type C4-dicarboxylate transport system substrate-binding protein
MHVTHWLRSSRKHLNNIEKGIQDIILEVSKEYEAKTGTVNDANYPKQIEQLKTLGAVVKKVPDSVAVEWAQSLKNWPQEKATELDAKGLPATQVLKMALEEAEKLGHKWPVRYEIK